MDQLAELTRLVADGYSLSFEPNIRGKSGIHSDLRDLRNGDDKLLLAYSSPSVEKAIENAVGFLHEWNPVRRRVPPPWHPPVVRHRFDDCPALVGPQPHQFVSPPGNNQYPKACYCGMLLWPDGMLTMSDPPALPRGT